MDFIYVFENTAKLKKMCNYFSGALDLSVLQCYFRWSNTRFRWCGKHFLWFGKRIETIGNSFRGKEEKRCRSSRCVIFMETRNLPETKLNKKECFLWPWIWITSMILFSFDTCHTWSHMYLIFYVIEECHLAIFLYFLNINGQPLANVPEINCSEISGKYLVKYLGWSPNKPSNRFFKILI